MNTAMVTARMSQSKKDMGNRVLADLGTTASGAINDLYDYVISNKQLPFDEGVESKVPAKEDVHAAMAWVEGIRAAKPGALSGLSLKGAKRHKLGARGFGATGEAEA